MQSTRKFGALSSSEDPQKLADTIKGIILAFGVAVVYILHFFGIDVVNAQISEFATGAGAAVSSLWIAYGLIKKFFIWVQQAWANRTRS